MGYGNIGKYALRALAEAPDFEIAGVVRRDAANREGIPAEISVVSDIEELSDVDVAILPLPQEKLRSMPSLSLLRD